MFLLHEVPYHGRQEILDEVYRLLVPGGILNVMDIRLNYKPNKAMLSGEPYLLDYLNTFDKQIKNHEISAKYISKINNDKNFHNIYIKV